MASYKLECDFTFGEVFGEVIKWILIILVTVGLAFPFYIYYFSKFIIENTKIKTID